MNRRHFLQTSAGGALAALPATLQATIAEHRIASVELKQVPVPWPRFVGRNAVRGHHGMGPKAHCAVLKTDQGATGWGQLQSGIKMSNALKLTGRTVASLIDPSAGIQDEALHAFDLPLHDLAGVILNQPVWKMLGGGEKPIANKVYSGMIYFDDLDPKENPAGIDKVLENCKWDRDYGYHQVKVKIGRGHKWMPARSGLRRDIEVVKAIHDAFPDLDILVDGNNGFTPDTMIQFLEGIGDVPLFWIEEPFHETVKDWKTLASWMTANGWQNTHRADGEAKPDVPVLEELEKDHTLDVRLQDICGLGFTKWRKLLPELKAKNILASPHAWGSGLKTVYIANFAAALGNHATIEGVTTDSDQVDFGDNQIVDGNFVPSNQPGFGLSLS